MYDDSSSPAVTSGVNQSPTVLRRQLHDQLHQLRKTVEQLPDRPRRDDVTFLWQLMTAQNASERQIIGAMAALTVIDAPAAGAALKWYPDKQEPGERLNTFADIAYLQWRENHLK